MATPGVKKAPARTEAPSSGLRSWVSAATDKVAAAYNGAAGLVSRASPVSIIIMHAGISFVLLLDIAHHRVSRTFLGPSLLQYLTWAADASWAIASTAVLIAIPVVIEVQRETTVKVMQKQREYETQMMEQQIKASSGGVGAIVDSFKTLVGGAPEAPQ